MIIISTVKKSIKGIIGSKRWIKLKTIKYKKDHPDDYLLTKSNSKFKNIHKGKRCFILGNGPSLNKLDFSLLKNEITFTVNQLPRNPIYSTDFFCPKDNNTRETHLTKNTVAIHHYDGSWLLKNDRLKTKIKTLLGHKTTRNIKTIKNRLLNRSEITEDRTKKVGIFTQYHNSYNYGGLLQSFALQNIISNMGYNCEQICFNHKFRSKVYCLLRELYHSIPTRIPQNLFNLFSYLLECAISPTILLKIRKRKKRIRKFSANIQHSSSVFSDINISKCNLEYDTFICGSDMIWNLWCNPYSCALGFVIEKKKKFSYSVSIGVQHIPEGWKEKYLKTVEQLDSISVREKSIAEELQKLIPDKTIHHVADPTLLYTAEEWNSILGENKSKEKYALIYILSEEKEQREEALRFSKNNSLKSLTFPNIHGTVHRDQKKYGDIQSYDADPLDFVQLIKDAEVVITDSFHACVFSALFHKPFYALKRESEPELVGRVESFLEEIGLSSQILSTAEFKRINEIPVINFNNTDKIIEKKRRCSISFLEENLEKQK